MDSIYAFTDRFRTQLSHRLEYSFDDSWNDWGVMVGGEGLSFVGDIVRFLASLEYAVEMRQSVDVVHREVHPTRYLFRVDTDAHRIHTISLYFRLPDETVDTLKRALEAVFPLTWQGPDLWEIANVLETPPEGIGIRMSKDGRGGVAAYFRVNRPLHAFRLRTVDKLTHACGFSPETADSINADMPLLYDRAHVGVVGLDSGTNGKAQTLKLDPANVSVSMVRAFLLRKGASPERLNALAAFGRSLGISRLSYIGLKYNEIGFSGWKMYWSLQPLAQWHVSSPSIVIDQPIMSPPIRPPALTQAR